MSDHYGSIAINGNSPVPPPEKQHEPTPKTPAPKKSFIFPLLIAVLIAGYLLGGTYIIPWVIQKYLPQYIENETGLNLSIRNVQLNPLNFQLTLEDITVDLQEPRAAEPLLTLQTLLIDLDFTSLIRSSYTCDKLTIENLQLNLIRYKDKHYNIPALSQFSKTEEKGDIINFAELPFLFSLNNIDIIKSRILFEDQVTDKKHIIEELQLAIPTLSNFDFQSKNYIQPHFSAIFNNSPIQLSGQAVQLEDNQGFQTQLSCSIKSLNLVPYFSYLPSSIPLSMSKGWADTTLEINFSPDKRQGNRLNIDIKMDVVDIEINGIENDFKVTVPVMKLDAMITPMGKVFHIKDIITRNIHLTGNTQHFQAALHKTFFPLQEKTTNPPTLQIDRFLTDQSRLTLLHPDSNSEWNDLQLTIKNYDSAAATGIIHISGNHSHNMGDFSWQATFLDSNTIQGKLLLNKFPAASLFQQLHPESKDIILGTATLSGDLNFYAPPDKPASYTLESAILQFQDLKLLHRNKPWLEAASVRFTRLSKTAEKYNLGNIFLKESKLTLNSDKLPPLFNHLFADQKHPLIKGIDFAGTLILSNNLNQKKPLRISDVHFQTNRLEDASTTENFAFSGHLAPEGIIKSKGVLNIAPLHVEANIAFSNIESKLFSPFWSRWPLLAHSKSSLHGKGIYSFPASSFQGDLRLTDSFLQTEAKTPLITWKSAELNSISCRFSPFSLQTESVTIDTPKFQWQRSADSPFQDFQKGVQHLTQKSLQADTLFPIEIKDLTVKNGSVTLVDRRVSPAWSTTITLLDARIKNFNTNKNGLAPFNLNGQLEDSAIDISGALALFDETLEARAKTRISNFPLNLFSKQLELIPVTTETTHVDLDLNMTEKQSLFDSKNTILLTNLQATSHDSDTALALAFLNDSNNSFPITIEISDSSHSLLKESIANFQTTVIKASYAPLLLDRSFKDLQDHNFISFQIGSNQINSDSKQQLSRYAELLSEHPRLSLTITGVADTKTDRAVLQKIEADKEQQRVNTINKEARAAYQERQKALAAVVPGKTLKEENIPKKDLVGYKPILARPVHIGDDILLKLAAERSLLVHDFFVHSLNISPQRLSIIKTTKLSDKTPANGTILSITTSEQNEE